MKLSDRLRSEDAWDILRDPETIAAELDRLEAREKALVEANEILSHALAHFANESKWGAVADYSQGYWYMTGKPWIPAQTAIDRARAFAAHTRIFCQIPSFRESAR